MFNGHTEIELQKMKKLHFQFKFQFETRTKRLKCICQFGALDEFKSIIDRCQIHKLMQMLNKSHQSQ